MNTEKGFNPFEFEMPTKIKFQPGGIKQIREWNIQFGEKPFIVTGRNSSKINGSLDILQDLFPNAVIYDEIDENPNMAMCEIGAEQCRSSSCDWIIALGGGSPIDAGKAIAGLATNGGKCEQYFGRNLFKSPPLPILAIPTTAGTGSEVTPYAVITNEKKNMKQTIADSQLFPRIAVLDPELTVTMPIRVTLATGLDALSQCMEGIVSKKSTPISDCIALEACKILRIYLPQVLKNPQDIFARSMVMYSALLSGMVIAQTGTTLVHALGYYYTLEYGIPHGIANALFLIPMFKRNFQFIPDKVTKITQALCTDEDTPKPPNTIDHVLTKYFKELGFSYSAKDWGVSDTQFVNFAEQLANDPYRFRNQYGEFSKEELTKIFYESF